MHDGIVPRPDGGIATRMDTGARHAISTLVLSREGPTDGQGRFFFGALDADRVSIDLVVRDRARTWLRAVCDGPARRGSADAMDEVSGWVPAGRTVTIELDPQERFRTRLDLDPGVSRCDVTVSAGGPAPYSLTLEREDLALPRIARLDQPPPACPQGTASDPLTRAFLDSGDLAATCPVALGATRMLPDGLDSLAAKVEALTGRAPSREALLAGDADMPLDFSAAPQLDLVYVNYLNLNADFSGYLVARMLAWHAARGTIVRILVSDIMQTETDRRLFEGLAARYPTVQIQSYRFPAEAADGIEGQLGRLHRVSHVKLFATVAREPGRSTAMVGGRNLHEGYFYEEPRDLSAWPFLHQYDPAQTKLTGGFTAYEDFEIEFRSDAAVRAITGHMAALWHRDHDSQVLRPQRPADSPERVHNPMMRHFLSVPFVDGEAQVDYFVALMDAAQQSIHIAIPYLNMPEPLEAALRRARERGVAVTVVTTVRVREATDFMVTGLNRQFANDFGDWVNFYDYDPYPRLLHAKLFVIDGRLAIVTSTNLNMRSFVHDLENGVVVLDRDVAAQVDAVIQSFVAQANRVPPGQEVPRLVQWLRRIGTITRAF